MILASRRTADPDLRAGVQRLVKAMSASVQVVRPLDAAALREARRRLDRRTRAYAPALPLIDLLLSHQGISLDEPDGQDGSDAAPKVPLPGFLYDMNRFFRALLSRFIHEHLGTGTKTPTLKALVGLAAIAGAWSRTTAS